VQASQFCGLPSEDASAHLQHFLELCDTIIIKDVALASIRLHRFPFSLAGKAKQWFYQSQEAINTWDQCSAVFLMNFFPHGQHQCPEGENFQLPANLTQVHPQGMGKATGLLQACPNHGMEDWLML
jgi:hypothetical protein